jgi:hypothetical protein
MTEEMAIQVARICEGAQNELLASLQSTPAEKPAAQPQDWMSAIQLAEYWQLDNDKNEPTTAGILEWLKLPSDHFPLPHAYIGDLLRLNREEVDLWARKKLKAKDNSPMGWTHDQGRAPAQITRGRPLANGGLGVSGNKSIIKTMGVDLFGD